MTPSRRHRAKRTLQRLFGGYWGFRAGGDFLGMSTIGHQLSQSDPTATSDLLTPDEVARSLRITRRHVRRLAAEGRLQRIKLGARTMRYTPESVAALINPMNTAEHDNKKSAPVGEARPGRSQTDRRQRSPWILPRVAAILSLPPLSSGRGSCARRPKDAGRSPSGSCGRRPRRA